MHKKLFRFFSFAAMIAVLILMLKIFNWLPFAIQGDSMKKYGSVEEIRSKLKVRDLYIPAYFPQNFSWPPFEIFAQNRPFTAVIMEFRHKGTGEVALIISQSASSGFTADGKIKIIRIKESIPYKLKDRNALLEVGICKNGEPCSRISWQEGRYTLSITAKYTPMELVRMAESMAH